MKLLKQHILILSLNEIVAIDVMFSIRVPSSQAVSISGERCLEAEIMMGGFREDLILPIEVWSLADYKRQWQEGLKRIIGPNPPFETSCLVTEMRVPENSGFATIWPLYRNGDRVHVQNKLIVFDGMTHSFSPSTVYVDIGPRKTKSDEGDAISEWTLLTEDLGNFLNEISF